MAETKILITAATNVGLIRQNNEDNFVVCPDLDHQEWTIPQAGEGTGLGKYGALLVVADGMGGANAGEVASAIAVETIQEQFSSDNLDAAISSEQRILAFMTNVVKMADSRIADRSKADESTRGMGTTVVMAWIISNKAYICWCGDSRCYVFNPSSGLVRLSKDHSYVQQLIDRGELTEENSFDHPYSNVITQCLGDMKKRANPDTRVYDLHQNDTLLLCSDGLSSLCHDSELIGILSDVTEINECKNALIEKALANGGHDNVTIAMARVESLEEKEKSTADIETETSQHGESTEGDEPEDTSAQKGNAKSEDAEQLSDTLESNVVSSYRRGKTLLFVLILIVLVCLITCVYLYFKGLLPDNITTAIDNIRKQLKI